MEILIEKHLQRLLNVELGFQRSLTKEIDWSSRLIAIKGARGTGKTTLLLQRIKEVYGDSAIALYASLDNIWFADNRIYNMADRFYKSGGKYLFLDEVHKYPGCVQEIKNIYDDFPGLNIVFTGSSLLEILNARADLNRRAVVYKMQGLSFREFLEMETGQQFPIFSLDDVFSNHIKLAAEVVSKLKPLQYFDQYLRQGYFPFYREGKVFYHQRVEEVLSMILEIELPLMRGIDVHYVSKLKQLLQVLAGSVPFVPNISKISERTGIARLTLLKYLVNLDEAEILKLLYRDSSGLTRLQKPDKLYLENPNFIYTLVPDMVNKGNLRETFLVNQLSYNHKVEYTEPGDIIVNRNQTIEVGGKQKTRRQIANVHAAWIASDDIEFGSGNKIPLWLFGFLY